MQRSTSISNIQEKKEKCKHKRKRTLRTKKKRAKEEMKRITRCESPSPSPIKKGTRKESEHLVIGFIQIFKCPPIVFPLNTPHQAQWN